jgi:NAD(P)-dependent dehydrogenase (short-subunit alcohol dehydrogenase family)
VPRLAPSPVPAPQLRPTVDSRRTAVISGGTRGLGLEMAKTAAVNGQKALVLMSRSPAMTPAQLAELARRGTAVFVVGCDAGNAAAAAVVRRWVRERLPAVQTYAHAAGALGHDLIPDVTPEAFLDVIRAKVHAKAHSCTSRYHFLRNRVECWHYVSAGFDHACLVDWVCGSQVLCMTASQSPAHSRQLESMHVDTWLIMQRALSSSTAADSGLCQLVWFISCVWNHVTMLMLQVTGAAACALPGLAPEHTAAGNAFLEATAAAATSAGLPVTAVNFGPFRFVPLQA